MPRLLALLLVGFGAGLGGVLLGGCGGAETLQAGGVEWSDEALRDHLRQLTRPAAATDSAGAAERTAYAVRQMRAAGLMPAREPSFLMQAGRTEKPEPAAGPRPGHVLGYVAGRHPSHSGELIVVAADLDSPAAAAVLETARVLATEALTTQIPERSVLFALWAPPRTGADGLADFLAHPTWALRGVERVLLVSADTATVAPSRERLAAWGLASEVVALPEADSVRTSRWIDVAQARTLLRVGRLTEALLVRTRAASTAGDTSLVSL